MEPITSRDALQNYLQNQHPDMPEFHQAVLEAADDMLSFIAEQGDDDDYQVLRYLLEPDRIIDFKIAWRDDENRLQINRGVRVQYCNALGPYKGGLRLDPKLDLSTLKFLGFEQTLKNSLTGMPMGGAKGGADFNPKHRSDAELERFCRAFMTELARHIGPDVDIPAGDSGVGEREIGWLFDQYRTLTGEFSGVITGKDPVFGGSCYRQEATGYGCVYFAERVLERHDDGLAGKRCVVSGSGNVALHTAEKLIEKRAKVVGLSQRNGTLHVKEGLSAEQFGTLKQHKQRHGDLRKLADEQDWQFCADRKPWELEADLAFACATQNEIERSDGATLAKNGCRALFEGANMPCTLEAAKLLRETDVLVVPGKAVNAGGVAVSGLEITQNRAHTHWSSDRVDNELQSIMASIHETCVEHGQVGEDIDYKRGANIAAFRQLSQAIRAAGRA